MAAMWVVSVALLAADGQVLLQRRPEGRQHGGLWEFPGGKVEPQETAEAAAIREMAEELGVAIAREDLVPVGFASNGGGDGAGGEAGGRGVVLLLYVCQRWQGTARALDDQALGWFAPQAVAGLAMPPLDYPLARALQRFVEKSQAW